MVPGAVSSPGTKSWSLATVPALTVIEGLVLAVLLPSEASEAVTVWLPAALNVMAKLFVPDTSAALAGKMALVSEQLTLAVSLIVLTRFQFASTALTVTLKPVPAVCAVGVPVLPAPLPGEAVSPGTSNCNFTNPLAFTMMAGLVLAVMPP